jgi:hypothetical protein
MRILLLLHTQRIITLLILILLRPQVNKRVMKKAYQITISKDFKIILSKEKLLSTIMMLHKITAWLRRSKMIITRKISLQ